MSLPVPSGSLRIITVEFHERMAFYGTTYILAVYLTDMLHATSEYATFVINLFYFFSPLSAIGAAAVADAMIGKAKVLAFGGCIYTVGLGVLTLSATPYLWTDFPDRPSYLAEGLFYAGITFLGFGYGVVKTCSAPLMAEQLPPTIVEPQRGRMIDALFNWLYWAINFGSLFGITICPLLRNNVGGPKRYSGSEGEYGTGFWTSFLLCFGMSSIGMVVFMSGIPSYRKTPIQNGLLVTSGKIIWDKIRGREYTRIPEIGDHDYFDRHDIHADLNVTLQACKVFLFLPIFWLLSNQQSTNYVIQAKYLGRPSFFPPELMTVVNTLTLLMFIPIYDRILAPRMHITSITKMTLGFIISACGMFLASGLQLMIEERGVIHPNGDYELRHGEERIPFYWQIPLFAVQSVSEVLTGVTAMKLAYSLAPSSMRSTVMAMYLLSSAAGSALGLATAPLCVPEYYVELFFGCGGLMLVASGAFYILFASFREKERANASAHTFVPEQDHSTRYSSRIGSL